MQKITTFNSRRLFNFDSYLFAIISFTHSLSLLLVAPNTQLMHTHTHPLSKCSTLHTPNPSLSHTHSNQTHYLALSLSLLFSFSWCANSLSVSKIQQYFVRLFVSNCISVFLLPAYRRCSRCPFYHPVPIEKGRECVSVGSSKRRVATVLNVW